MIDTSSLKASGLRLRSSIVCVDQGRVLTVKMQDPDGGQCYFFPPGGAIEPGEDSVQAAIRETLEETGYCVRHISGPSCIRTYDFRWNGIIHHCRTHFEAGELIARPQQPREISPWNLGPFWIDAEDADKVFGYHPDILSGVKEVMDFLLSKGNM